jgi:hypothetical protein
MQKLSPGLQFLNPEWILGTGSGPVKHRQTRYRAFFYRTLLKES